MILSPCGKRRVCFFGVAAKRCHCNLVVTSAFTRGHECRWLRDNCGGWRVLAVAPHLESSKALRVVFGYVSFRVQTRTLGQCGQDLAIVTRHTNHPLYDTVLPANHSDLDLTSRILAFCAIRGTACGYTKSHLTFVAPCFITRTPSQCTA
jgi:hypothetical protein